MAKRRASSIQILDIFTWCVVTVLQHDCNPFSHLLSLPNLRLGTTDECSNGIDIWSFKPNSGWDCTANTWENRYSSLTFDEFNYHIDCLTCIEDKYICYALTQFNPLITEQSEHDYVTRFASVIRVVDVESFRDIETLIGHDDDILKLVYLEGYNQLISSSLDQTIKIWSTIDFVCLQVMCTNSPSDIVGVQSLQGLISKFDAEQRVKGLFWVTSCLQEITVYY